VGLRDLLASIPRQTGGRGYAAIDFETTGLFPQKHDRVVEVAIVEMDMHGRPEREWTSLIDPERDVGPTHIHGISARDVLDAPRFSDVVPHVMESLRGRTIVAHNASFDLRFLEYELSRAGWPDPRPLGAVCTMRWSKEFLAASSRKLVDCCAAMGIDLPHAHQALNDVRGVAGLLYGFLAASRPEVLWSDAVQAAERLAWPDAGEVSVDILHVRGSTAPRRPGGWLDRIVARMPRRDDLVEAYLGVLEAALLDRYLSVHEETELVELASVLGLSRHELDEIHRTYLKDMARVALADGVVTRTERADLQMVATLLGSRTPTSTMLWNQPTTRPPAQMASLSQLVTASR
jgi:DNA polymerase III subunit epsilon